MNHELLIDKNVKIRYRSKMYITMMAINIALSSFFFGYCNNYFATINIHTMIDIYGIPLEPSTASGILNGLMPLFSMVGTIICNFFISRYSRREVVLMTNALAFLAGIIIFIQFYPFLFIARMMQGICAGSYAVIAPLIIRQIAPTEIAGVIGSIHFIFFLSGISFVCCFQYLLSSAYEDPLDLLTWRYIFAFPFLTLSIQTFNLIFIFPFETPKYYLSIGQKQKARKFIELIYKQEYVQEVQMQKVQDWKYKKQHDDQLQKHKDLQNLQYDQMKSLQKNAIFIAFYAATIHQLTCISPVSVYVRQITKNSHQSIVSIAPAVFNTLQLVGILAFAQYFHQYGRKTLLVNGSLLVAINLFCISLGLIIQDYSVSIGSFITVIGLLGMGLGFGLTFAPSTLVYISQIIDPDNFSKAIFVNRLSSCVLVTFFPILTTHIFNGNPYPLFIFFGCLLLYSYFFYKKYLIETKDKQQKQIRIQFSKLQLFK